MGLIRKIIVVSGALMAMPSPPQSAQDLSGGSLASWSYISAAAETVSDFKNFCERKPQVCVTAKYLAGNLETKAKYSAKMVYEWANESANVQPKRTKLPDNLAKADEINTGTAEAKLAMTSNGTSTLRIEDLIPEWRGTLQPEKG
jgi:hypothetical protein